MAMPNFNTPAASNSGANYDVFISHRGPDVKNTFASHLYRGLCHCGLTAFLDKEELQKGDTISSQIELAISGASVQIAILSPNFAESHWCLDELVLMKNSGATILPVFFKVDPSEVRYTEKHGVYFEAMLKLEGKTTSDPNKPRYASETIQKWRAALSYVAGLSGFVHGKHDDEGELLENVVERVLKEVPKTPLDVAKYPTGLDNKLEDFKKTVLYHQQQQQESERLETKVIGIVGIGGVGKTTLAKSFFNSQRSSFKESSFLSDVREAAAKTSLNSLQSKLFEDLQYRGITVDRHNGIELFQRHLKSCHAMIVLDDIDHISQLDAFLPLKNILSPGSLILVTSRDKHVLISSGVSEQSIYHLKGLDTPNSQELFCFHAFHKPLPPPEFADLVDRFVEACDGLPLSLKVFGAQVCGLNEKSLWEEILDELDKTLPTEIYDKLKISYDSLEPKVKEIFLDIACFFLGEDGDKAMRIWGKLGIQDLQYRCLVELDGENTIQMHDHIRDMGRKIAEEGSIPLRLWQCTTNSIEDLLEQRTNLINEVRGIKLVFSYSDCFRYTKFWWHYYRTREMGSRSFSRGLEMRLRYLRLVAAEEGYLEDILRRVQSPHLIWLRWYGCNYSSLPDWIPMENLRVLEVEGSTLNTLWAHQSQAVPLQLRELNIYAPLLEIPKSIGELRYLERIAIYHESASTLERLPDEFCELLSLKYVVFSGLSRMVLLPDRFGELTNLQHIELREAGSLQMLPNSFGNLQQLKHISLEGASSLQMLPDSFGELTNLQYINLDGVASLQMLPNSLGNLQQLKHISFKGASSLQMLPYSFGNLSNLKILSLSLLPQLKSLPDSIGLFTQLTELEIERCGIEYLPRELLKMNNLKYLYVKDCPLREHPFRKVVEGDTETLLLEGERELNKLGSSSDRCLLTLKKLNLSRTELREVSFDEGVCPNLKHFTLTWCSELRQIGGLSGLETLTSLQTLQVMECEKLQSIQGLGTLTKLTGLYIHECPEIRQLPGVEHLISLESLKVGGCKKLHSIPGLGKLTKLTKLDISECPEIRELPGLGQLTKLTELKISNCPEIRELPGLGQLTKLTVLHVRSREMQELPDVEHLTSLKWLYAWDCQKLQSIPGLGKLTRLTTLDISRCLEIRELQGVEYLISLEKLNVGRCEKLQSIPGLGKLTRLTFLNISECLEIRELQGVEYLISLEMLYAGGCEKLQSIPGLGKLTRLTLLYISECLEIRELQGVEYLISLEKLYAGGCEKLQSIPGLGKLTRLTELDISRCLEIRELQGVEYLISLEKLNVGGCEKLQSIPGLGKLTKLTELDISECPEIRELPGLGQLTKLTELDISECPEIRELPGLGKLTRLTELDISRCLKIRELQGVEYLISLEKLNVGGCKKLQSIPGLGKLTGLTELDISRCPEIRELPGLGHLTKLTELNISGYREIQELPGVEHLTSLVWLCVRGCKKLEKIRGLGQLTQMRYLNVAECYELQELPGVEHLTSLEKLYARKCKKLQSIAGLGQLTKLTQLVISGCREIRELPGLGQLTKLTDLNISGCREIQELPSVEHLTSLERLHVGGCKKLEKIRGLGQLTQMRKLDVSECNELQELPGVEDLMSLEILNAGECPKLQWSEGVVEQLRQQLNDGFIYERRRKRCSCLHFYVCGENVY